MVVSERLKGLLMTAGGVAKAAFGGAINPLSVIPEEENGSRVFNGGRGSSNGVDPGGQKPSPKEPKEGVESRGDDAETVPRRSTPML